MITTEAIADAIGQVPADAGTLACDRNGQVRDGAWVVDITDLLDLGDWPAGMRVIVRMERPHPGRAAAVHRPRRPPVYSAHTT